MAQVVEVGAELKLGARDLVPGDDPTTSGKPTALQNHGELPPLAEIVRFV